MDNRRHSDIVISAISGRDPVPGGTQANAHILASWERCLREYRLEPHQSRYPDVYAASELRNVRTPIEDLIGIATPEVDRLFSRLAQHNYVVTLTDSNGVVVMFRCLEPMVSDCTQAGVLLGAKWSEDTQGTNGIGTCIRESRSLSVVMSDHFSEKNIGLACTVAPIFGNEGQIAAVLNVTTANGSNHTTESLIRTMVQHSARRIENRFFERRHTNRHIVRISRHADFSDIGSEVRVALDANGQVIDATPEAIRLLSGNADVSEKVMIARIGDGLVDRWTCDEALDNATFEVNGRRMFARRVEPSRKQVRAVSLAPSGDVSSLRQTKTFDWIGRDPVTVKQVQLAQRLVDRRLPVLLRGETGSGKSMLAKVLHQGSIHRRGAFVTINCAAIPAELIESELFGYRPGSFTGAAKAGSKGRVVEADGGTLFLDEIGDMPLPLQTRLLQVLSDGEFVPVGGTQPIKVSFALISATLHDVPDLIRQGRFRQDLYFRLNGVTLELPPLSKRLDRNLLIDHMLYQEAKKWGVTTVTVEPAVFHALNSYGWPGNVRELQHVIRYALAIAEEGHVTLDCLPPSFAELTADPVMKEEADKLLIMAALSQNGWNVSLTASLLNMSRATLHRRIAALGLKRPVDALPSE
jgi:transcriptional regulator of acetoin/glycerol metabolism